MCRRKGKEIFLALTAAGRVVSGAGLASFHRDRRVPCRRASPWPKGRGETRVCVFPPQGLGIQRGRGGRRGQARLARPRLSVGAPAVSPLPRKSPGVGEKQEGFFFFFLPQERSRLRQGGEGAGGGGPGSSLPHGRCLTGSPKSPGDYGTGSRPLGAAEGGPGGLTGARGPAAAAAPRSSPSPAARLLDSRRASVPLM